MNNHNKKRDNDIPQLVNIQVYNIIKIDSIYIEGVQFVNQKTD